MGKQCCVVPESDIMDPKLLGLVTFRWVVVGVRSHMEEIVESDQCEVAYSFSSVTGECNAFVEDETWEYEQDCKFRL